MAQLEKVSKVRLYEQVLEQLNGFIERGEWKPGCKIPSEKELRNQLGVGTAVLRETFRILESKNIIESRQGQGRYLRHIRPELVSDDPFLKKALDKSSLLDVLDIRINLEIAAVEMLITRGTDEKIAKLEAHMEKQSWENAVSPEKSFEACVARATGNVVLTSMIIDLLKLTRELEQRKYLGYEKWRALTDEHKLILQAIKNRDLVAGRAAVYRHIYGIKEKLIDESIDE
ncbi:FCD domain-containing protein [Oscillibacter sp. MSJ-2]|uniref:FCD domain-containing protein n=1 Tax=Dysosmobacter acutus TaxID=2841504 RepID=A0ABS6F4Y9_9FIRM|nr:FCD domain-containing protein [Dysosmobacter acutus]MBU5625366.1 FCD domain-containing protein [Dysosmobacter acutus]